MSADSQDESSTPNSNQEPPAGLESETGDRRSEPSSLTSPASPSEQAGKENSVIKGHIVNLAAIEAAARRNQTQNVREGSPFKPNTHQFHNQPLSGRADGDAEGSVGDQAGSGESRATAAESPRKEHNGRDPWDEGPPVEAKLLVPSQPAKPWTGVVAETARSGVVATGLILPFAVLGAVWFPAGAIMVGGLGVLLGMVGLSSPLQKIAATFLLAHMAIFAWAYYQLL